MMKIEERVGQMLASAHREIIEYSTFRMQKCVNEVMAIVKQYDDDSKIGEKE